MSKHKKVVVITVIRSKLDDTKATTGKFYVNGVSFGVTLEPTAHALHPRVKRGTYQASIKYSPKHKRRVIWLEGVPGRSDVQIHVGNQARDTLGCILVGTSKANNQFISGSKKAFDKLMQAAEGATEITVVVR